MTEVHLGDAQVLVLSEASLDVGDSTVDVGDLVDNTSRAVSTLASSSREGLGSLVLPLLRSSCAQELHEVISSTGLLRAVDNLDVLLRKIDTLVDLSDLRVVPLGDLAVEDFSNQSRGQSDVNTLEVVGNGNRTDNHRQVPCFIAVAALLSLCDLVLAVLLLQRGVRASESNGAGNELSLTGTRARCVVRQGRAGLFKLGGKQIHGALLRGSALALQLTGDVSQTLNVRSAFAALFRASSQGKACNSGQTNDRCRTVLLQHSKSSGVLHNE